MAESNNHPYKNLSEHQYWRRSVSAKNMADVDPVVRAETKVSLTDKVATAGSCFAQHIARHLSSAGFNYYVSEKSPSLLPAKLGKEFNYGLFSARYGNIYTARQLLQLWKRAFNGFVPREETWRNPQSRYLDPLRPNAIVNGFSSEEELEKDREFHLSSVRKMFSKLNVFVFTLGLTEAWVDKKDGTVFPLCPGVAGGTFSPDEYEFKNFSTSEIMADMQEFLGLLKEVNPSARVILTVSPVPLVATAEDRHVIVSTTLSKSVLRVACEELTTAHDHVHYFPSYEIITSNFNRGAYYEEDLRSVKEEGVKHVMKLFLKHYTSKSSGEKPPVKVEEEDGKALALASKISAALCDEEMLDR